MTAARPSTPDQPIPLRRLPQVTTVLWDLDGTLVGFHERTFGVLMPMVAAAAFADLVPPWRFLKTLKEILPQVRANAGEHTNHELLVHLIAERLDCDREAVDARLRRLAGWGFPLLRRCFYPQPEAGTLVARATEALELEQGREQAPDRGEHSERKCQPNGTVREQAASRHGPSLTFDGARAYEFTRESARSRPQWRRSRPRGRCGRRGRGRARCCRSAAPDW